MSVSAMQKSRQYQAVNGMYAVETHLQLILVSYTPPSVDMLSQVT